MNAGFHLYPGVRPFETKEQHLFFGRNRDIEALYELILLERLTVLFGKSGYGKSSLLSAGIIPRFTNASAPKSKQYQPVQVRFGTYVSGKSLSPVQTLLNTLDASTPGKEFEYLKTLAPRLRLWHHFKMQQALAKVSIGEKTDSDQPSSQENPGRFLLFFDQFEEFFSYPVEQQIEFRTELAELLYEEMPQDVRLASRDCTREQRIFLATPFDVKTILAIRSDRLSLLDSMKDRLPAILHKRYELQALDETQAREAIVMPAAGAFTFSDEALAIMIRELSGKDAASKGRIETFQLQIVCSSIEKRVNERNLTTVTAADLPDFKNVYEDYYKNRIAELPAGEQESACQVLENGLLLVEAQSGEARRLSRDSVELAQAFGVSAELLSNLERSYLIRREVNTLGGFNYEISHDTLIAPILKARRAREAVLEQQEQEKERTEALRRAKEAEAKAQEETARRTEAERLKEAAEAAKKRATVFAIGAGALALLAAIAFGFAQIQAKIARNARDKAQEASIQAESSAADALRQKQSAESSAFIAQQQKMRADTLKDIAQIREKEAQVSLAKVQQANDNIVDRILAEANAEILALRYEAASAKCSNAAAFGRRKPQIAAVLLEIAYYYTETGQYPKAEAIIGNIAGLLGKSIQIPKKGFRNSLRSVLQQTNPSRFAELEAQYYPVMRFVNGGAGVPSFKMAEKITNFWQYNLFLQAMGRKVGQSGKEPETGWSGTSPAVWLNWYDAVQYTNWLSEQQGLSPYYSVYPDQKDTNNISDIDRLKWTVVPNKNSNGFRLPTSAEWQSASPKSYGAVLEWCWDWSADGVENTQSPSFGRYRVAQSQNAEKGKRTPSSYSEGVGFRVAQSQK